MSIKKLKAGNVVLSEYGVIGQESKHTLINVYSGDIVVAYFPAQMNFCAYIELMNIVAEIDVTIRIMLDNTEFGKIVANLKPLNPEVTGGVIFLPSFQVGLLKQTHLSFVASSEGYAPVTILKKRISQGPILSAPIASQPPPSQSQPDAPAS